MFNTTRISQATAYPQTITERRAPTDESVRLLSEMEQAAEKRVLERGRLENNDFKATWTTIHEPYEPDLMRCHCRYLLNGRERSFEFSIRRHQLKSKEEFKNLLVSKITQELMEHVGMALLEQCHTSLFPRKDS